MLAFLDYHAPVDDDPLVLSLIRIGFYACGRNLALNHHINITAWLVNSCTYSKSNHNAYDVIINSMPSKVKPVETETEHSGL